MKTWLDKLCEPLEHPKYPQIKGILVEYDERYNIVGKCAEGEIICQNELKNISRFGIDKDNLDRLGIPKDLQDRMPRLKINDKGDIDFGFDENDIHIGDISNYIFTLNDYGYSYPEIIEFLR